MVRYLRGPRIDTYACLGNWAADGWLGSQPSHSHTYCTTLSNRQTTFDSLLLLLFLSRRPRHAEGKNPRLC